MKKLFYLYIVLCTTALSAQVDVDINFNVKHTVGNIDTFDRSKFITIHANQTETEWDGDNFTNDLRNDFLNGLDVYLGRDTGGITWNLNNMEEDPTRAGYADPAKITTKGTNSRNSFASKTNLHPYENRKNHVVGAQLHPFWTGESQRETKLGWKLANPTAVGEYMGRYFNAFHGGNGQKQPEWVEVINEPAYEALGGKTDYTNSLQEIAEFHVEVADAIREQNSNLKIGGYTVAFPDFETGNFQRWTNRDKLFIDVAGEKMDFWAWHLYDFPAFGGKVDLRSGSNLEATFDMNDQYSMMTLGTKKPYVISEYGAQTHDYNNEGWSAYRDWLFLKAQNSMMLSFMERPDDIAIAIPFTIVKAEWGFNHDKNIPYGARLMRKTNEPSSYTGQWIYTDRVKFYQLWKDVKGTRIDTKATDLDIQVDAYVDDNKAYLILNNLEFEAKDIALHLFDENNTSITSVKIQHLTLDNQTPVIQESTQTSAPANVVLGAESTMIIEYTFNNNIVIDESNSEKKYFATSYLKPISANTAIDFEINGITKNTYGEAVLRVGVGRDHGQNLHPTIFVNNTEIEVPTDYRGYNQADKARFFGVLEIPVPYALLEENNTVQISFPDTGGHVSSVTMQVFNFSANIRERNPNDFNADNYQIKTLGISCVEENNGVIEINTQSPNNYSAEIKGTTYESTKSFSQSILFEDLAADTYSIKITIPEHPDYEANFKVTIDEPQLLKVATKLNNKKNQITLDLSGSEEYQISINNQITTTSESKISFELTENINQIEVKTDKECQGNFSELVTIQNLFRIYPIPAKESISLASPTSFSGATAYIYNSNGKLNITHKVQKTEEQIDIHTLSPGVYFIKIYKSNQELGYSKFIVI
ncbi:T9SS type A sorting domain-containing protein [Flavicella marina]|uniref:T9SS type A sorting domain-containing protein n=1 Tax=Flavicella marina TaxID=1475951 RepID=UPI0012659777|nr:T9SS type A sorting domain-containing protein [Flavicella marina]